MCNSRAVSVAAAADQTSVQGVDHRTTDARVVRQVPEDPPDEVAPARTPAGRSCRPADGGTTRGPNGVSSGTRLNSSMERKPPRPLGGRCPRAS
jgi:hypothetical protein